MLRDKTAKYRNVKVYRSNVKRKLRTICVYLSVRKDDWIHIYITLNAAGSGGDKIYPYTKTRKFVCAHKLRLSSSCQDVCRHAKWSIRTVIVTHLFTTYMMTEKRTRGFLFIFVKFLPKNPHYFRKSLGGYWFNKIYVSFFLKLPQGLKNFLPISIHFLCNFLNPPNYLSFIKKKFSYAFLSSKG